ncbi:MAG TPA: hypothetical protein QGH16_08285, partial [Verrucomicrobiota bacterium]|nr:hypothetical protein [Verrucomicrobiota bacterium]
ACTPAIAPRISTPARVVRRDFRQLISFISYLKTVLVYASVSGCQTVGEVPLIRFRRQKTGDS